MKRNAVVTHTVDPQGVITFNVIGAGSFTFDPSKCTDDTERSATIHGYVQKISDKAAIGRDAETGRSATPREKYNAMKALADHLQAGGAWIMRQPSKAALNRACLFTAVATVRGIAPEVVAQRWQDKSDDVLRTVLTHRDVAAEYARLTAPSTSDEGLFEGL